MTRGERDYSGPSGPQDPNPDEGIDCGACEPECPVTAIFPEEDVPGQLKKYIQLNRDVFQSDDPPGRPQK